MDDLSAYLYAFKHEYTVTMSYSGYWITLLFRKLSKSLVFVFVLFMRHHLTDVSVYTSRLVFNLDISCSNTSLGSITIKWIFTVQSNAAFGAHRVIYICTNTHLMKSYRWLRDLLCVHLGLNSLRKRRLISIGIPIINLRRTSDRLRFVMGIPIPVSGVLLVNIVCKTYCIYHCISPKNRTACGDRIVIWSNYA